MSSYKIFRRFFFKSTKSICNLQLWIVTISRQTFHKEHNHDIRLNVGYKCVAGTDDKTQPLMATKPPQEGEVEVEGPKGGQFGVRTV